MSAPNDSTPGTASDKTAESASDTLAPGTGPAVAHGGGQGPGAGTAPATGQGHGGTPTGRKLLALSLGALGVVYGDIGTSPLYALRECFGGEHAVHPTHDNVLGVLSLVFWALVFIISVKYLMLVMRADNRGEGGILALLALVGLRRARPSPTHRLLLLLGLFGAALLYGDGMITPAISVLSAVEGLGVATHTLDPYVVPITMIILVGLFLLQPQGTGRVGAIFGPVMLTWFLCLALMGVGPIVHRPEVLKAVNPFYGVQFFQHNGWHGFLVLGSVFLTVTGGEALYADMGHFGRRPIRLMWFAIAQPALLLNYFGQGATVLDDPTAAADLFYRTAPAWALYPLVALATFATVIASQALISASFSLTRQAVQLGYSPRLQIVHTSSREIGQIYVPQINWVLMIACLALVWSFKSSSNLAAAYGLAVTATMGITTMLFFAVARELWGWPLWRAGLVCLFLLVIDLSFFGANLLKILDGGWFPLVVGGAVFTLMTTWKRGREILGARLRSSTLPLDVFLDDIRQRHATRVPGTAVFMSGNPTGVPHALLHNLKHNKVLHERNVLLTVTTEEVPHVAQAERLEISELGEGFWRMVARYGFMEDPNIPQLLDYAKTKGFQYKMSQTTFFLGRETLIATKRPGMAMWREKLFAAMSLNARSATSFFDLPANRVVELGAQIEL